MSIKIAEGPKQIPTRARFGFRISRQGKWFASDIDKAIAGIPPLKPWKIERWAKPPNVYVSIESHSLVSALRMLIVALRS